MSWAQNSLGQHATSSHMEGAPLSHSDLPIRHNFQQAFPRTDRTQPWLLINSMANHSALGGLKLSPSQVHLSCKVICGITWQVVHHGKQFSQNPSPYMHMILCSQVKLEADKNKHFWKTLSPQFLPTNTEVAFLISNVTSQDTLGKGASHSHYYNNQDFYCFRVLTT